MQRHELDLYEENPHEYSTRDCVFRVPPGFHDGVDDIHARLKFRDQDFPPVGPFRPGYGEFAPARISASDAEWLMRLRAGDELVLTLHRTDGTSSTVAVEIRDGYGPGRHSPLHVVAVME